MNCLVDTNILIDYLRGNKKIFDVLAGKKIRIYYSIVTKKELLKVPGLSGQEAATIHKILKTLRPIRIDPHIAQATAMLLDIYKKERLLMPDAVIAATAWVKKMPLLTRNVKHFRFIKEINVNTLATFL